MTGTDEPRSRPGVVPALQIAGCLARAAMLCLASFAIASCARSTSLGASIGSFYVPGRELQVPGTLLETGAATFGPGEIEMGQTYVHFVRLKHPRTSVPVLMIPGGSLTGAAYETTPDGRPGWQSNFLGAGYSVLVADFGEAGRSPPPVPVAGVPTPLLRAKSFLWDVFRLGPPGSYSRIASDRRPYPDTRFPIVSFDAFTRQTFPRFREPADVDRPRYRALIEQACPCIVIAHSASAGHVTSVAVERPDLVRALVLVEPSGAAGAWPANPEQAKPLKTLFVWGDHLADDPGWREIHAASRAFYERLKRSGAETFWLDLPANGIAGNSHLIMMDNNSDAIARLVLDWLEDSARQQGTVGKS